MLFLFFTKVLSQALFRYAGVPQVRLIFHWGAYHDMMRRQAARAAARE
ncbi:hypothetical protein KNP414_07954 [Paenibacillus mucilaginosus KNP414]|uniref:Uncharacterized protein n=1 Tax=Paenibacillus mucilaginosus (strain KNP414) TaxID=1036673 RepID=F8FKS1_PAEMK|nr:hypothetical protein KNP414_07954 [Paenibacillus mucilaginosus KNP414]